MFSETCYRRRGRISSVNKKKNNGAKRKEVFHETNVLNTRIRSEFFVVALFIRLRVEHNSRRYGTARTRVTVSRRLYVFLICSSLAELTIIFPHRSSCYAGSDGWPTSKNARTFSIIAITIRQLIRSGSIRGILASPREKKYVVRPYVVRTARSLA